MNAITRFPTSRAPETGRFTTAEFIKLLPGFALIDARVELDRGTIVRMPPPYLPHTRMVNLLARLLQRMLEEAGSPLQCLSEVGVQLPNDTARVPDVSVFADPGLEPFLLDVSLVELAIEVADTSLSYDLGEKALDYARALIADYWVVDLKAAVVHVHTDPGADGYATRRARPYGQPLHAACLPATITIPA